MTTNIFQITRNDDSVSNETPTSLLEIRFSLHSQIFHSSVNNEMEIKCVGSTEPFGYRCLAEYIKITERGTLIKSVKCVHEKFKTNMSVQRLVFKNSTIEFFPRNLHRVFPNLTHLSISRCGLKEVIRKDLEGLENLIELDLSCNKLKSLPEDLFADMKSLHTIHFYNNELECLSSGMLNPIKHTLTFANFLNNSKINTRFSLGSVDSFERLKTHMDIYCTPPQVTCYSRDCIKNAMRLENLQSKFETYFESGEFSDFTIKLREREFKVHKFILVPQSSLFRRMFSNDFVNPAEMFKDVKSFGEETFESFLRFFYTGHVDLDCNGMDMYELASDFDVPELKKICIKTILRKLQSKNALEVFNFGHIHAEDALKFEAFGFIKKDYPAVKDWMIHTPLDLNKLLTTSKQEMDSFGRHYFVPLSDESSKTI